MEGVPGHPETDHRRPGWAGDRLSAVVALTFDVVDPMNSEARTCVTAYFAELDRRFPGGFAGGKTGDTEAARFISPEGGFIVVHNGVEPVGCGGVQTISAGIGEIKRMWVSAPWRGLGVGSRLLAHLEKVAVALGFDRVRLDTNSSLVEAIAMYRAAGYREIPAYNDNPDADHWFERRLDLS